jgi:hypothetical protein
VIQCPRQAYNHNRLPGGTLSRMPVQQPVRLATRLPNTYPRFQPRQSHLASFPLIYMYLCKYFSKTSTLTGVHPLTHNFLINSNSFQNEVMLGRMIGPFSTKPISMLRISPIGLVSKSDGGWRLITHLSNPQ